MKLNFLHYPHDNAEPLVIIHGLMGSSRNWVSCGKDLSEQFDVYALDLRNHGDSPHDDEMTFEAMEADLALWIQENVPNKPIHLMGHSLGGKIAMRFACHQPKFVKSLTVVDISPRDYEPHFINEFAALNRLNLNEFESRGEVEKALETDIPDWGWRKFFMTSLGGNGSKGFHWKVNLPALTRSLTEIRLNSLESDDSYNGPTLFIKGGDSDFIRTNDRPFLKTHFPKSNLLGLKNSGHNPHIDNRPAFVKTISAFCRTPYK